MEQNTLMALVGSFIGMAILLGIGTQILGNSVMDLVEDMREKGVEEQEIDECLFDELQSILNEGRKGED